MPTIDRKLRVFLSYAQEDFETVHEIYNRLKSEDWIEPWQDKPEIDLGETWAVAIKRAINSADAVVVFLSENSINKEGFVHYEMRYAWQLSLQKPPGVIFLIPIRLDSCDVPVDFYELDSKQWGDYFNGKENETYIKLLKALRHRLEQTKQYKTKKQDSSLPIPERSPDKALEKQQTDEQARLAAEEEARKAKAERDRIARQRIEERKKAWAETLRKINFKPILTIGGIIIVVFALFFIGKFIFNNLPESPALNVTATSQIIVTLPVPTETQILPTNTPEPPTITPTPAFGIGSTVISEKDGVTMLFVPVGKFVMGDKVEDAIAECKKHDPLYPSIDCDYSFADEAPPHEVDLPSFWIDQTEVTNAMYAKCVSEGVCKEPLSKSSSSHSAYYGNSKFDDYPVIHVNWDMAKTYCEWRGDRLPTEAEWEKAARGTDGRTYPWGEGISNDRANYFAGDTKKVGTYQNGMSPYGLYDMAGNVLEWVNDWYDVYPGGDITASKDFGQKYRVLKGGYGQEFITFGFDVHSAGRWAYDPEIGRSSVGFRCAQSAP